MLDITKIVYILSWEVQNFTSAQFLMGGIFAYIAYFITHYAHSVLGRLFWFCFSLFLFFDVFTSSKILFNEMFYIALGIFITHRSIAYEIYRYFYPKKKKVIIDDSQLREAPRQCFGPTKEESEQRAKEHEAKAKKYETHRDFLTRLNEKLETL